jgi:hypothetical protein
MSRSDDIKRKTDELESLARDIESVMRNFFVTVVIVPSCVGDPEAVFPSGTDPHPQLYCYEEFSGFQCEHHRILKGLYFNWCLKAELLIGAYSTGKYDEFQSLLDGKSDRVPIGIEGILDPAAFFWEKFSAAQLLDQLITLFRRQRSILSSLAESLPDYQPLTFTDRASAEEQDSADSVMGGNPGNPAPGPAVEDVTVSPSFRDLRDTIQQDSHLEESVREAAIGQVYRMEASGDSHAFDDHYSRLVEILGDRFTVVLPFIPWLDQVSRSFTE